MYLNEKMLKQHLIDLKVPSGWFISKNNILDIDFKFLKDLDEDEFFRIREIYLYANIFFTKYDVNFTDSTLTMLVTVTAKPDINEEQNVNSLSYEIEVAIGVKFKKNSKQIYYSEIGVENIGILKNKLNKLFLYGYLELDEVFEGKKYSKMEEDLNKILCDS